MNNNRLKFVLLYSKIGLFLFLSLSLYAQGFEFVENKGQWENDVKYKALYESGYIEITSQGYRVIHGFSKDVHKNNLVEVVHSNNISDDFHGKELKYQVYEVRFKGADTQNLYHNGVGKYQTKYNYYQGNDQSKWASDCSAYKEIWIRNIYPSIDIRFYKKNNFFKYDIVINPGGKVDKIKMQYVHVDNIKLISKKRLQLKTSSNYHLYENMPLAYKEGKIKNSKIKCNYILEDNKTIRFDVDNYSLKDRIIIDPEFSFSTFSGSKAHTLSFCSSFDSLGNFLGGSIVFGPGFPITLGNTDYNINNLLTSNGFQTNDVGFFKLSSDGANNLAATVFGSNDQDAPLSIKEASDKSIIIVGKTYDASTFPTTLPHVGTTGGVDIFVAKLDAQGRLLASRIIGGSGDDGFLDRGILDLQGPATINGDVATVTTTFDQDNNLVIASPSQSTDFPVIGLPAQSTNPTGFNAYTGVLMKVSQNLSTIHFSGYIGGNRSTTPHDIEYNASNNRFYVVGATLSTILPSASNANSGGIDGYVMEIENNPTGYAINRSQFIGTPSFDAVYNIDFDNSFFPYIVGSTSGNWPVSNANFLQTGGKQFIVKYTKDFSSTLYSTTFGPAGTTAPSITISSFLIDFCENIYVAGWGGPAFIAESWKTGFATKADDGTLRTRFDPTGDYYIIVLEKNANDLLYAGFLGSFGGYNDHFHYGENRFDNDGILYQTVCVCATQDDPQPNFPVYPQSPPDAIWSLGVGRNKNDNTPIIIGFNSAFCNASFVKILFQYSGVKANLLGSQDGGAVYSQTIKGCVPVNAILVDRTPDQNKGKTFYWFFESSGKSRITTTDTIHHTFVNAGVHRVRLISEDLNACITRDTSYIDVNIQEGEINIRFKPELSDCSRNTLTYNFINTTTSTVRPITNTKFIWDFGDGTPQLFTNSTTNPTHTYSQAKNYTVTLKYEDPIFCKATPLGGTFLAKFSTNSIVATAKVPSIVCINEGFELISTASGHERFSVDWGDGTPVEIRGDIFDTTFRHTYTSQAKNYQITITASIPNCNESVTTTYTIQVSPKPSVDFSVSPLLPGTTNQLPPNTPAQFLNLSSSTPNYTWDFGDGVKSNEFNPSHLFTSSGEKNVKLVVSSPIGCSDSITKVLTSIFIPILNIASAFSPNGDNINDEIGVEVFGEKTLEWKVYNRRGNLIFETNNASEKWNGKDKNGVVHPADTYFYSISAEFKNNESFKKSGEITLLK